MTPLLLIDIISQIIVIFLFMIVLGMGLFSGFIAVTYWYYRRTEHE